MPEFKILDVKVSSPRVWFETWTPMYDASACGVDAEYAELISLAKQNKYLVARGVEQGLFQPAIDPEAAALVVRAHLPGMAVIGLRAPGRAQALAEELFAELQPGLGV